jgi:hypothetical protein
MTLISYYGYFEVVDSDCVTHDVEEDSIAFFQRGRHVMTKNLK